MTPADRSGRVLVAGLGNIFLGDDAFGVEVARKLAAEPLPAGVRLLDVGVRSVHLGFEVAAGGYHTLILIDAVTRGGAPGTLYLLQPEEDDEGAGATDGVEAHAVRPDGVVALARRLGGQLDRVLIVGCEPATFDAASAMSAPVAAAVDDAARLVLQLCV